MLYERLTGREFLAFLAQLRGIPQRDADERIEQLLAILDLNERASSPCGAYSFGMKRKLALAGALVHQSAGADPGRTTQWTGPIERAPPERPLYRVCQWRHNHFLIDA